MIIDEENYLSHYGVIRRSGRYPWGSSNNVATRSQDFLGMVDDLRKQGLSEPEIARGLQIGKTDKTGKFRPSTTELRALKSIAKNQIKQAQITQAQRLRNKGMSNVAIGKAMGGLNESSVRALLAPGAKDKADVLQATSNVLKEHVANKKYLDVGAGTEEHMGISSDKLNTAVAVLRQEGYPLYYVPVRQLGTGKNTNMKILAAPGTPYSEVSKNRDSIRSVTSFSEDGGRSYLGLHPPISVNPKRVGINYAEDGGSEADGVIFVRPGVSDISLGTAKYAQVRIKVGDGHYLKGMAMYKDNLPSGTDLVFNTKKSNSGNKIDAMKKISDDPDNPFGSIVRQRVEVDASGKERVTSAMNIVNEEGDWSTWSGTLSSQMLSKQSPSLATTQLDMTYERRQKEFQRLSELTNPTVRKVLLEKFGDETDAAAVKLDAAAPLRTAQHVILPVKSMKANEIYAPNFRNGESVVLVRHPHGGKFEIPELTVNNNHAESKRLLGRARDAVGIHPSVAARLSGADFDGDTVLVIPNNSRKVKTSPALEGLKSFDAMMYKLPDDSPIKRMTAYTKGIEMGDVSNLITDMSLKGASTEELARAVRHSMVVIDAEKHHLNYKQSSLDNGIKQLKTKFQGGPRAGASTLISRARSNARVPARKPRPASEGGPIDKETGKRVFVPTGESFKGRDGQTVVRTDKVHKLSLTDDAHTLSSGTTMENVYAGHSNKLKALANEARKVSVNTPRLKYSASAKKTYAPEVSRLTSALHLVNRNRPLERQAQVLANSVVKLKAQAKPDMDAKEKKKVESQALEEARSRTGAKNHDIVISDREWQAIQAGAVSDSVLSEILKHADIDVVRAHATPKREVLMTASKTARAKDMLALGYTRSEVADALGVSLTTLDVGVKGES